MTIAGLPGRARCALILAGAVCSALEPGCYEDDCKLDVVVLVLEASGKNAVGATVELDELCCEPFHGDDPARCRFMTNADGRARFEVRGFWDCTLTVTGPGGETVVQSYESDKCEDVSVTVELPAS